MSARSALSERNGRSRGVPWALVLLGACTGSGSDIGPVIPKLPNSPFSVLLRDDSDRGVTGAVVSVRGFAATAASVRSGRADLFIQPRGTRVLDVRASFAAASDGDLLGNLTVETELVRGDQMPFVIYLPDVAPSAGARVDAGVLPTGVTIDDRATSGAVLSLTAGTVVAFGGRTADIVRTGDLSSGHLPPLPHAGPGAVITTRGGFVHPPDATFQPGAEISLPNDLGLPAAAAVDLWRLDPTTGRWSVVGGGTVDPDGSRITSDMSAVAGGGLHTFAVAVADVATLFGRVVDPEGRPLDRVRIRARNAVAVSGGDGRFELLDVARVDGAGIPIPVLVEIHGGRRQRPVRASVTTTVPASPRFDLGDRTLDTRFTTLFRGLLVSRGKLDPFRRIALNSVDDLGFGRGLTGSDARFCFENIDAGDIGFVVSRLDPRDDRQVLTLAGTTFLKEGEHHIDLRLFMDQEEWLPGRGGGTQTWIVDRKGTGLVTDAALFRNLGGGDEFVDVTNDNEIFRIDYGNDGQATASLETGSDGRFAVSAFTVRRPEGGRLELPLERANRDPNGRFEPFGFVRGRLPSSVTDTTKRVRGDRRIIVDEWFDDVFFAIGSGTVMPRRLDPGETGGDDFLIGVPVPEGLVVGALGDTVSGRFSLERLAFATSVRPVAGASVDVDLGAPLDADTTFALPGALIGKDASLTAADFAFDLAIELGDGTLIDAAREVSGNLTIDAAGARVRLPALGGRLDQARHLLAFRGRRTVASGAAIEQRTSLSLGAAEVRIPALLPLPVVSAPSPGSTVSSNGFDLSLTSPGDALVTVVNLRREGASVVRDWTVVLPQDATSFRFRRLPETVANPLAPGPWRLTVRSARVDTGPLTRLDRPYQRAIARWVGLSAAELQVAAVSSVSFDLTMN